MLIRIVCFIFCASACFSDIPLSLFEKKVFSQQGEDGVTEKIFSVIGSTNRYYVEFNVGNGEESNTRYFKQCMNWDGVLFDRYHDVPSINLHREPITAENINVVFEKYQVPEEFDLLSIDDDFNDFHIWNALDSKYRPRVVIIEYNATHLPTEDRVSLYDPNGRWDGTNYFGGSILSMYLLGQQKGYSLVYAEKNGVNLFFVRDDVIQKLNESFENTNQHSLIYRTPRYGRGPNGGHMADPKNRAYTSGASILMHQTRNWTY